MTCAGRAAGGDDEALHALLLYESEESLCAHAVPYLREGLDRGEAVMAVVSASAQHVLSVALGDDAGRVRWQAGDVSYGRLGVMFEGFRQFLAEHRAAGVSMRLLAENGRVGTPERMAAYLRFEAMANEVYRPYGYRWACLYDTRTHSTDTLRHVRQVHPRLLEHGGQEIPNGDYLEPGSYLARSDPPAQPPAAVQLDSEIISLGQLVVFRRWLRRWAEVQRINDDDADGVVIAVGEAVTNALQHGAPPIRVRAWTADGRGRVHVHDRGPRSIPATAGYRHPSQERNRGYGLWLARQLADVVTTYSDRAGTTIALDFPLATRP
jgi:anti-sigma regulatory factor (Ser/Thr protein kinase)